MYLHVFTIKSSLNESDIMVLRLISTPVSIIL